MTSIRFGIEIGPGFYVGHFGNIFISDETTIGSNCNISQEVSIGTGGRKGARGVPHLRDRVYVGAGTKIFGPITIGSDAAISTNTVVVRNVAPGEVVGGVPAKVISRVGSDDFTNWTDWDGESPTEESTPSEPEPAVLELGSV